MAELLITWLINSLALIAVTSLLPGIHSDYWSTSVVAALFLGLLNAFVKPIVMLLTLPINIYSLGLFTLVINGALLYLVSRFVVGFTVENFSSAVLGALLFSVFSSLLSLFLNLNKKINVRFHRYQSSQSFKHDDVIDVEGKSKEEDGHNPRLK